MRGVLCDMRVRLVFSSCKCLLDIGLHMMMMMMTQ
jgi:hypothetical protein